MAECKDKWTRDQKLSLLSIALMVFFEVLNHLNVLSGVFGPVYEIVRPFVPFPLGIAVGWLACRSLYTGKIRDMETTSAAEQAKEIERIRSEYEKQLAELRRPDEVRTPSGRLNVNLAAIRCTDHAIIAAAVAAFDDERHIIPLGKYEKAVRKSIGNRDGIFSLSKTAFCGMPGDEDGRFHLTQKWLKGMDDREIIDAMRSISEKWEASH